MTAQFVTTDDASNEIIPQGMSHYEVTVTDLNVQSFPVTYSQKHFLHFADVMKYVEAIGFTEFTVRRK